MIRYDSLNKQTIVKLYEREGGQKTIFFVPLGLKNLLRELGIGQVIELDWWDEYKLRDLRIVAV